jgi:bifunctional DNA-binding transcriptional regulator/antitoxin component of YhaV-PrlF toxin-antitoxin module
MITLDIPMSQKNQVTIPRAVRDILDINGQKFISLVIDNDSVIIRSTADTSSERGKIDSRFTSVVDSDEDLEGDWNFDFTENGTKPGMPIEQVLAILEKVKSQQ